MMDASDHHSLRIDDTASLFDQMSATRMSQTEMAAIQRSLGEVGLLTFHERMISHKGLVRFELTPAGLKWWLQTKLGHDGYSQLAQRVMDAYHRDDHDNQYQTMATMAGVTLREFQQVFHAETNGAKDPVTRMFPGGRKVTGPA